MTVNKTGSIAKITILIILLLPILSCGKGSNDQKIVRTKTGIEMVSLPAGWSNMGSDRGEPDESPVHRVWVDAFLMDRYEMTQENYGKLVQGNPSHFKGPGNPMEQMSWAQAALYCNARSRAEGLEPCYDESTGECDFQANGYRLPTEAEWEYACRAGTDSDYFFGRDAGKLSRAAWYSANSQGRTHPVGQKIPNPWGLYDMYGNVAEWCNDIYSADYYSKSPERNPRGPDVGAEYVLLGGSWNSSDDDCRSSSRASTEPGFQDACFARDDVGFRCVRSLSHDVPMGQGGLPSPIISLKADALNMISKESASRKIGFVYDDIYLQHETGRTHPESPQRLSAILTALNESGIFHELSRIKPSPASLEWLTTVHSREYVDRVRKSCQDGIAYMDSQDTPISPGSYQAALTAVGGVLAAIDAVMAGEVKDAFCAVRPPGHHALRDRAMGFCLFNNVAIGARYVQEKYGLSRVLIVDWDVHHGNGTQAVFYDDPSVLYFSTHRYPFYPGTGSAEEKGTGKGLGYNINVPMAAGSGDAEYMNAFDEKLKPAALKFRPDFVLISAGFDAHRDDPLGGMKVSANGFGRMTSIVRDIAEKSCGGRLVSVLEGGYSLTGLTESVLAHIREL